MYNVTTIVIFLNVFITFGLQYHIKLSHLISHIVYEVVVEKKINLMKHVPETFYVRGKPTIFPFATSRADNYRNRETLSFTLVLETKVRLTRGIQTIVIRIIVTVPMEEVHGVLGKKIGLPCDISPRDRDDAVAMVLWFKESIGEPLYR